jgi:hypothetical protein
MTWIRALVVCDDIRLEVGGTMTLVGVLADRIVVGPTAGEIVEASDIVLPRAAVYGVVAGLTGTTELVWKLTLDGQPIAGGTEVHEATFDEHRLISFVGPLRIAATGGVVALEVSAAANTANVEHRIAVERAAA